MTNESRLEQGIIGGLQGALTAKIDAQTIYHLLMDKGICTREEIQAKKEYISKQYKKEQDMLIQYNSQKDAEIYAEEQMENMLSGKEYDKEYLTKMLNDAK